MPDPREPGFIDLVWLLEMSHVQYLDRFGGTAVRRAKHWMLQRNAAVALGNTGDESALATLAQAMRTNENAIVRGHAAWAIGRIGHRLGLAQAVVLLDAALPDEIDEEVRAEIRLATADCRR